MAPNIETKGYKPPPVRHAEPPPQDVGTKNEEAGPKATPQPHADRKLTSLEGRKDEAAADKVKVQKTSEKDGTKVDTRKLKKIGEVVVGDGSASLAQNSRATVAQSDAQTPPTADVKVHSDVPTPRFAPQPIRSYERPIRIVDWNRREEAPESRPVRTAFVDSAFEPTEARRFIVMENTATEPASVLRRFVLDVHDVHDMGGSPSSIVVLDANGRHVRTIPLQPGDSQYTVDLPDGDFTFRAVAGQRPDAKSPDARDNFRMEVYEGKTESGEDSTPKQKQPAQEQKPSAPAKDADALESALYA